MHLNTYRYIGVFIHIFQSNHKISLSWGMYVIYILRFSNNGRTKHGGCRFSLYIWLCGDRHCDRFHAYACTSIVWFSLKCCVCWDMCIFVWPHCIPLNCKRIKPAGKKAEQPYHAERPYQACKQQRKQYKAEINQAKVSLFITLGIYSDIQFVAWGVI